MTRGIPYLIHEIAKLAFQNNIGVTIESISDKQGKNTISRTPDTITITTYEGDEDVDKEFEAELDVLADSLRTTPL